MSKYNARRVQYDGIKFDAVIEKDYYLYLKQQKKKGLIKDFSLQPEFVLQPKFEKNGEKFQPIKYKADFKVIHNDGSEEVIDVKGMVNAVFSLKKKMFHYHFDDKLKLITYSKVDGGWITLDELEVNRKVRKQSKAELRKKKEVEQLAKEVKYMKNDELMKVENVIDSHMEMAARTKSSFLKYIKENFSTIQDLLDVEQSNIKKMYKKKVTELNLLLINLKGE